jgi:hypothetical protein
MGERSRVSHRRSDGTVWSDVPGVVARRAGGDWLACGGSNSGRGERGIDR